MRESIGPRVVGDGAEADLMDLPNYGMHDSKTCHNSDTKTTKMKGFYSKFNCVCFKCNWKKKHKEPFCIPLRATLNKGEKSVLSTF